MYDETEVHAASDEDEGGDGPSLGDRVVVSVKFSENWPDDEILEKCVFEALTSRESLGGIHACRDLSSLHVEVEAD